MTADTMSDVPQDALVARLRSMCKSLTHDRSFTAAQLVLIAYAVDDAIARIEALTAERDDAESTNGLNLRSARRWKARAEAAEAANAALLADKKVLLDMIRLIGAIPTMTDEQLADLRANAEAAIAGRK